MRDGQPTFDARTFTQSIEMLIVEDPRREERMAKELIKEGVIQAKDLRRCSSFIENCTAEGRHRPLRKFTLHDYRVSTLLLLIKIAFEASARLNQEPAERV